MSRTYTSLAISSEGQESLREEELGEFHSVWSKGVTVMPSVYPIWTAWKRD